MLNRALRHVHVFTFTALTTLAAAACGAGAGGVTDARSDQKRDTSPNVPAAQVSSAAQGERDFGVSLYGELKQPGGNVFFSPHSIAEALTMLYAGAANETQAQMRTALQLQLPDSQINQAMNALDLALESRGQGQPGTNGQPFALKVANAIWGQQGFTFLQSYLDTIAVNYGAGLQLLDFQHDAGSATTTINNWVAQQTDNKILNLLPPNAVGQDTRLVLTNAVYFDASWAAKFTGATSDLPFTRADGSVVSAPTMQNTTTYASYRGQGVTAVELPYAGDQISMVVIEPDDLASFEAGFSGAVFDGIVSNLKSGDVQLYLPKWDFTISSDLVKPLESLGMDDAFDAAKADFSGIDGQRDLYVSDVLHKAFISVDEKGTEAAAATAVIVNTDAVESQPLTITIDHPFIFAIRDIPTGAIVFLGRVVDPTASN